jgi:2'-hydroxyisoflavone reductase
MKVLVLGGTGFLGRHIVAAALARGDEVTTFNRGISDPGAFSNVEKLFGDREGDLDALRGRRWDVAIDCSGYIPRAVRASARLLADAVDLYAFISSISVYAHATMPGLEESDPVLVPPAGAEADERVTPESYGWLKAAAERAAEEALPGRVLVVRAGLLIGPYDNVARFTYWVHRVAEGGEVLAPGRPTRPVQIIDARDLADFLLQMAADRRPGTYNVTGLPGMLAMGQILRACRGVTESESTFTWVSEEFLRNEQVPLFDALPFWVPESLNGLMAVSVDRAVGAGLSFRPLAETIHDTGRWIETTGHGNPPWTIHVGDIEIEVGISRNRERALLESWHALHG